ncbi:MAG TPA: DJ-1/PfpI family protein, partial [Candidatus Dormibacteraeota bacterium]
MRVACVLDVDFEDSEFRGPYDAFHRAGHEVTVIGLRKGTELLGKKGEERVTAERGIDDVSAGDF